MINVIHQDDGGRVTRAHQRVPRHAFIRLCLIWRSLRRYLARADFGPGQIQYVDLYVPEYIQDMGPQEFLRCVLLPVSPFRQYGDVSSLWGCTLNDVMGVADHMEGYTILTMFLHLHVGYDDTLTAIFSRVVSRYAPGGRGWAAILQFLYQFAQPWHARRRLAELWRRINHRMGSHQEARDLLRDLDIL